MEILDVIDQSDQVIGQATKEECHSNPALMHHTVQFTLIDKKNRKVFLTQRSFKKAYDAGKICFLGEHVLSGESYADVLRGGRKKSWVLNPFLILNIPTTFFSINNRPNMSVFL